MRNFDFSPLFRSTVGFDRMTQLMDATMNGAEQTDGYPIAARPGADFCSA